MDSLIRFLPQSWGWIVVVGVLYGCYKFLTWNHRLFKRIGINGPKPYPIIGTMWPMIRGGFLVHYKEMRKYGTIVGTFQGKLPFMIIYDLEIAKQILVKEFSNFTNHFNPGVFDYPMKKLLTMIEDDHWKHVRNHLAPVFSSGKLRKMNGKILHCVETLLNNLDKKAETKEIFDFRELCGAYTMDVIASTAFGVQIDSHNDANNDFVRMAKKIFDSVTSLRILVVFFFPFLMKPLSWFGFSIFPKDAVNFFSSVVDTAMAERQKENKDDVDFVQLMVNVQVDDENIKRSSEEGGVIRKGLTHEEILAQGILFFLGGYETTANTLSLLAYLLAIHPECQEKLIKEIDEVMADEKHVTYDIVQKMPYLEMCIDETLRIYPVTPRSDRVARNDITINGVFIPKGMVVVMPIYYFQNDPEIWPEPEKFNPERFTAEAKESRDAFSYMPFGMGPRNCIGMRLALMELKMSMVHILQRLKFVACEETQVPLKLEKLKMQGVNGIRIKVEKRH